MVRTIHYRVGQFLRALAARVPQEQVEQATRVLPPEARKIFRRQAVQDQRHALEVYRTLCQAGQDNSHLLAAALLHDVGKAAGRLPAWQRAAIVVMGHFTPRLLARLSKGEPRGWRRSFVVRARHPEVGACWATEAGCSPLTVALIRRHHDELTCCPAAVAEENQLLAALQAADRTN
jgi:hypothetical protein